jgi:probable phosphoglycerate mutase
MTRFLFIRHAEIAHLGSKITGRCESASLTRVGVVQAGRIALRLAQENVLAIYSSPQERARETARVIADHLGQSFDVAAGLDELDYGDWTGQTIESLRRVPQWQAFNSIRSCTRTPNGESMLEAQFRIVGVIDRLRERHRSGAIALVTHGDLIRAALAYYLGSPLDLMLRLDIHPASISTVEIDQAEPIIRCINNTEALCP